MCVLFCLKIVTKKKEYRVRVIEKIIEKKEEKDGGIPGTSTVRRNRKEGGKRRKWFRVLRNV